MTLIQALQDRLKTSSQLIGLDIGSQSVKIAELRQKKSTYELITMDSIGLPKGTVVDGDILDACTLEEAIKELFSKGKIKKREVAFALSGSAVISKRITIPNLSIPELESQLSIIAAQYIPFPIEEMSLDYQLIPSSHKEAQKMDLVLVAVKRKLLESYKAVIEAADLKPFTAETTASALANFFSVLHPQKEEQTSSSILIHLGACLTHFMIIDNNIPIFNRDLEMGGNRITEHLRENLKLSFPEAEALKISSYKEKHLPQETMEAVTQGSQFICHEIEQSLHFYMNQYPDTPIQKIYICGGTSKIPPLREWIQEKTGFETVHLKPFETILYDEKEWDAVTIENLQSIIPVALGLAMRGVGD